MICKFRNLATTYRFNAEYQNALRAADSVIFLAQNNSNNAIYGRSLFSKGSVYQLNNRLDSAMLFYAKSAEVYLQLLDTINLAKTYNNIGIIAEDLGDTKLARKYHSLSLELKLEIGDQNQIASGIDSTRFLDYHIAIKDAIIDNKFVVWVNEQVVDQKQVRLSNITPVAMMESTVSSIGPNVVKPISNITPGISGFAMAEATAADASGTVTITTDLQMLDSDVGGTVGFAGANTTALFGNNYNALYSVSIGYTS